MNAGGNDAGVRLEVRDNMSPVSRSVHSSLEIWGGQRGDGRETYFHNFSVFTDRVSLQMGQANEDPASPSDGIGGTLIELPDEPP